MKAKMTQKRKETREVCKNGKKKNPDEGTNGISLKEIGNIHFNPLRVSHWM